MTVSACPPVTPPVHGVVTINTTDWRAAYPEFTGLTDAQITAAFNNATLVVSNSCKSLVRDANKRETLLYLLTAHCAFLRFGSNDGAGKVVPAPGVVGRVNNAHEGSVSVSVDYPKVTNAQAWFVQTQWGALFWQSTAKYRTMVYIPPPTGLCGGCGLSVGSCLCGEGLGPTGTGLGYGYNGGTA